MPSASANGGTNFNRVKKRGSGALPPQCRIFALRKRMPNAAILTRRIDDVHTTTTTTTTTATTTATETHHRTDVVQLGERAERHVAQPLLARDVREPHRGPRRVVQRRDLVRGAPVERAADRREHVRAPAEHVVPLGDRVPPVEEQRRFGA
jgi:hypothetical protein